MSETFSNSTTSINPIAWWSDFLTTPSILILPAYIDALASLRVVSKTSINKETTQTGFHDGRSTLVEIKAKVGDTCIMQIPDQKILDIIKLEAGCQGLVTRGINAGQIGKIESVEEGTFILPKRVILILGDKKIEIQADIIMPIGKEEPVIQLKW